MSKLYGNYLLTLIETHDNKELIVSIGDMAEKTVIEIPITEFLAISNDVSDYYEDKM